jgi:hypothetical protein
MSRAEVFIYSGDPWWFAFIPGSQISGCMISSRDIVLYHDLPRYWTAELLVTLPQHTTTVLVFCNSILKGPIPDEVVPRFIPFMRHGDGDKGEA